MGAGDGNTPPPTTTTSSECYPDNWVRGCPPGQRKKSHYSDASLKPSAAVCLECILFLCLVLFLLECIPSFLLSILAHTRKCQTLFLSLLQVFIFVRKTFSVSFLSRAFTSRFAFSYFLAIMLLQQEFKYKLVCFTKFCPVSQCKCTCLVFQLNVTIHSNFLLQKPMPLSYCYFVVHFCLIFSFSSTPHSKQ